MQSVMKTYAQLTLPFIENQSTSSREDFPANPTATQERGLGRPTKDISFLRCLEQSKKLSQDGSLARTFVDLLVGMEDWYSTRCALTWKAKAMKSSRFLFQLQASTPRTEGIGSGLLLTPGLVEIAETPEKYQERQRKRTEEGRNQAPHPGNKYNCLTSQILYSGMLPTPMASDCGEKVTGLETQDSLVKITREMTGKPSQLSPHFVLEMMGFPTDWTELPFQSGETKASREEEMQ